MKEMPSQGDLHSVSRILQDIRTGLLNLLWDQYLFLRSLKGSLSLTVAVGDIYPVLMAAFSGLRPIIFMGTAKSNWYYPYSFPEKFLLKRFCLATFARDLPTTEDLKNFGINSIWAGNPMMDCFNITGENFGVKGDNKIIGILPGSRDVAYRDFPIILSSLEKLSENLSDPLVFLVALSPSIRVEKLADSSSGWNPELSDNRTSGIAGYLRKSSLEIKLIQGKFGDVINISDIIIGQAGTGNEQAAGLGKPVVAFDSEGKEKMGWYRARQKGLLGDALSIVKPDGESIAGEVIAILRDKNRREYMSKIGKERMKEEGSIDRITDEIIKFL
ncbi:MAG: hypothetical protein BWY64_03934 [bacterium ADurb.Bin363]|nr:MAG: hypothetical protein BWY64_03934 [bacterium ADurb.Bin363]